MKMHPTSRKAIVRAIAAATLPALLGGCVSNKQAKATVLYQEGCVFYVDGLTNEQAESLVRSWDFGQGCEIKVVTEGSGIGSKLSGE